MRLAHCYMVLIGVGILLGLFLLVRAQDPVKTILAEYGAYKAAAASFEEQYGYRPGDFPKATSIWGLAGGESGTSPECYEQDSRLLDDPKRTCDGNGNGTLLQTDGMPNESAPEWYRAWHHLSNAGLVDGSFSGKAAGWPRGAGIGENVPASAIEGSGYTMMSYERLDHRHWFPGIYWGVAFGEPFTNVLNLKVESRGPAISVSAATRLDLKIDDGHPRTGIVRSVSDLKRCVSSYTNGYDYQTEYEDKACGLFLAFEPPGKEDMTPFR